MNDIKENTKSTKEIKEYIINYICSNQKLITIISNSITRNNKDLTKEMVSRLNYEVMIDKIKFKGDLKTYRINNFITGCLRNYYNYSFYKKRYTNYSIDEISGDSYDIFNYCLNNHESIDDNIYKTIYEMELHREGFSDEQIVKLSRINSFTQRKLSPSDKILYNLYFTEEKTMRDIAKQYNMSLTTIFNMIKKLKVKLIDASNQPQKPLY